MNKFILEQLQKAKINLPQYDNNTTQLLIKKSNGPVNSNELQVGNCYYIYIEDYIINEPDNFTLSANWNNGTKPKDNKVNAKILQIMGKMVKIYSVGLQSGFIWEGWIPIKSFKILEDINV